MFGSFTQICRHITIFVKTEQNSTLISRPTYILISAVFS